jgi:hypothetical protein
MPAQRIGTDPMTLAARQSFPNGAPTPAAIGRNRARVTPV